MWFALQCRTRESRDHDRYTCEKQNAVILMCALLRLEG